MPNDIPSLPKHPKPKSKRKKPRPPKLRAGPSVKPLDVFEVALSADAGANSSRKTFDALLSQLSRPQLDQLDRLVQKVQNKVLANKKEQKRYTRICKQISDATSQRKARSMQAEIALKLKLQKRLKALDISSIKRLPTGKIKNLHVKGTNMTVQTFIKRHLTEELHLVESLLADATLLQKRGRESPQSFLKRLLEACL